MFPGLEFIVFPSGFFIKQKGHSSSSARNAKMRSFVMISLGVRQSNLASFKVED